MLVGLLPGLRELRNPLAAGYTLLFSLYLWLARPVRDAIELAQPDITEVRNLVSYLGPAPTLAGVTFIAFLLGALWIEVVPPIVIRLSDALGRLGRRAKMRHHARVHYNMDEAVRIDNGKAEESARTMLRRALISRIIEKYLEDKEFRSLYIDRLSRIPRTTQPSDSAALERSSIERAIDIRETVNLLMDDLKNVPARLLGKEPEIWSTWDRTKSEGEFRQATATALVPLVIIGSVKFSLLYLLIVPACISFWMDGIRKTQAAQALLIQSVVAGRVPLSEMEKLTSATQVIWNKGIPVKDLAPAKSWEDFGRELRISSSDNIHQSD